ncbi:MAG: gamma-glutamyltransferase [Gammaproteobacteria bacterium]|nr:gamma-glutamyltransferase [Gammaproteobacteria bacterium]
MRARHLGFVTLVLLALAASVTRAASPAPAGAERGMVVCAHRLASEVGVAVLRRGGNAVDAAIATAYALAVTFPEAGNLGGGGFMLVRMADGRESFIDFRETAPAAATRTMFLDANGEPVPLRSTRGYPSAAIPGTVAGLELARTGYGTRPRAELVGPAIKLAAQGFVLDAGDAEFLAEGAADFRKDAPASAIFLKDGRPYAAGERLVQKDLARMLRIIARDGAEGFYRGEPARLIVEASRQGGGLFDLADFARYRAVERKPLECSYRGYRIVSAPPPSSGGTVLCQSLNLLSGWPADPDGFNSAQSVHYMTEALRRAFRDRNLELGDPDFVRADVQRLISPAYADDLRRGIDADKATPSRSLAGPGFVIEGSSTTHVSVVDEAGNAVALTYTLNDWFGARVVAAGTGILLNDEMDDFSAKSGAPNMYGLVEGENNAIAPGKRPLSSMTPTIVTRDGKLLLVIGTPGGSHIPTAILQAIVNLIDYRMTITEAVDAPRIHAQWIPDTLYYEPNALSADTRAALAARGHRLEAMGYWNHVAAILVGGPAIGTEPRGRDRLYGAIDPRVPVGSVAGY